MLRFALFVLLLTPVAGFGQDSAPPASSQVPPADKVAQPVSSPVLAAEAAIVKSDWKGAETGLSAWLAAHPTDARALFDAGYVADAQNRLDDAASLYRRAVEANASSLEAHLSLGLVLARQGKLDDARPELAEATTLESSQAGHELKARAWRALARIDEKTDTTEASNDLLEALKLSPETEADTLLAANLADQSSQDEAAEAAYRRVLSKDPKSAAANAGLAHLLMGRKQFAEAETMLRAALQQIPGDPTMTAQLAAVLAAQNKAEALPLLKKLHEAQPNDSAITRMLAEVLAESKDPLASDSLYAGLLKDHPNDPTLLLGHAQNLIFQAKYAEAFAAFDKVTQLDTTNGEAWSGLAFAALRTNQPAITLKALTMRSKYLPENPGTYFLWATAYDTLHDKAEAASFYHHFLESSAGKFPDQEWQARQRLIVLENRK